MSAITQKEDVNATAACHCRFTEDKTSPVHVLKQVLAAEAKAETNSEETALGKIKQQNSTNTSDASLTDDHGDDDPAAESTTAANANATTTSKPGLARKNSMDYSEADAPSATILDHNVDVKYQLEYLQPALGSGSRSCIVRRGVERSSGNVFAVKSVKRREETDCARLVNEANILKDLHPQDEDDDDEIVNDKDPSPASNTIIKCHETCWDKSRFHLILEPHCVGGEVYAYVNQRVAQLNAEHNVQHLYETVVPEKMAATIMAQLVEAMAYCHETCHVVHRDLKLENILFVQPPPPAQNQKHKRSSSFSLLRKLSRNKHHDHSDHNDGEVYPEIRVADFGIAVRHVSGVDAPLTERIGSPYYIAPEVLQRHPYDQACDIWSMGVIAFMLLTGEAPICCGPTPQEALQCLEHYDPKDLFAQQPCWNACGNHAAEHPSDHCTLEMAKDFIQQCLQVDPTQRPSAKQLLQQEWIQTAMPRPEPQQPAAEVAEPQQLVGVVVEAKQQPHDASSNHNNAKNILMSPAQKIKQAFHRRSSRQ